MIASVVRHAICLQKIILATAKTIWMRLFLILYVIVVIGLNFLVDDGPVFLLALSTFPATAYLLLTKKKTGQKKSVTQNKVQPEHIESNPLEI